MTALTVPRAAVDKLLGGLSPTAATETDVLLTAYAALLHRHTAQDRVAVGVPGQAPRVHDFESGRDLPSLLAGHRAAGAEPVSLLEITRTDEGWALVARPAAEVLPPDLVDVVLPRFEELLAALADDPALDVAEVVFHPGARPRTWRANDLPF
ncbi:MAG: hypothetical protein HOV94_19005, partial [Saccharothrix sp.]|nr:hypothetical protein [Saccharothrix sp.]